MAIMRDRCRGSSGMFIALNELETCLTSRITTCSAGIVSTRTFGRLCRAGTTLSSAACSGAERRSAAATAAAVSGSALPKYRRTDPHRQ